MALAPTIAAPVLAEAIHTALDAYANNTDDGRALVTLKMKRCVVKTRINSNLQLDETSIFRSSNCFGNMAVTSNTLELQQRWLIQHDKPTGSNPLWWLLLVHQPSKELYGTKGTSAADARTV